MPRASSRSPSGRRAADQPPPARRGESEQASMVGGAGVAWAPPDRTAILPPARSRMSDRDDTFELYDMRVEVVATDRPMVCGHRSGDWLELRGENLTLPAGQPFSIYALAALIPILPAKQRVTHPHDWITTDTEIACPDPNCGARFRITRIGTRTFRHGEVTAVPLPPG